MNVGQFAFKKVSFLCTLTAGDFFFSFEFMRAWDYDRIPTVFVYGEEGVAFKRTHTSRFGIIGADHRTMKRRFYRFAIFRH